MARFISQKIQVKFEQRPGRKIPLSFEWEGEEHELSQVISVWEEHGLPGPQPSQPHWWQRRHRIHYLVETKKGKRYEIYWDRGSKKREWILYKEVWVGVEAKHSKTRGRL